MSTDRPSFSNSRYEFIRRIARGGRAEVYLARDTRLDRPVAVKVLFPELQNVRLHAPPPANEEDDDQHSGVGVWLFPEWFLTVNNLNRDGTLWKWSTWRSAASYLFGKRGMIRQTVQPWRDYKRRDFHPSQHDSTPSQRWLADYSDRYTPVGARS